MTPIRSEVRPAHIPPERPPLARLRRAVRRAFPTLAARRFLNGVLRRMGPPPVGWFATTARDSAEWAREWQRITRHDFLRGSCAVIVGTDGGVTLATDGNVPPAIRYRMSACIHRALEAEGVAYRDGWRLW
jgi:hypothetical protein